MSTTIRPELSEKSKNWINKHRYYELKHFCLQYPTWKKAYYSLDVMRRKPFDLAGSHSVNAERNPTECLAEALLFYRERMELVEKAAMLADGKLCTFIIIAVTEGVSYEYFKAKLGIPCCREVYYGLYRKFFRILSDLRQ